MSHSTRRHRHASAPMDEVLHTSTLASPLSLAASLPKRLGLWGSDSSSEAAGGATENSSGAGRLPSQPPSHHSDPSQDPSLLTGERALSVALNRAGPHASMAALFKQFGEFEYTRSFLDRYVEARAHEFLPRQNLNNPGLGETPVMNFDKSAFGAPSQRKAIAAAATNAAGTAIPATGEAAAPQNDGTRH